MVEPVGVAVFGCGGVTLELRGSEPPEGVPPQPIKHPLERGIKAQRGIE